MGRLKHLLKLKHPTLIEGGPMTTMESQGTVSSHHRRSTIVTLAGDGSDKEGDIELKHERFAALGSGLEVPHNSGGGQSSRLGAPTPSVRSNKRPAPIDESTCEKSRDTKKLRLIAPEVLDVPASKSLSDGKQYSGRCGDTVIHNFTSTSSVPTSTSVPTSGCRSPNALLDILLPTSRSPGPNVAIADFCRQYELSDQLCKKLTEQGFARARALRFLTDSELVKHGFSFGERASLRDAIESWSEANI
ncbi:hypothetical protein DL96DRAFT_393028 [Flagelloscypha sp. PMI_526]|nr:hypothetical protein DL96DRAFT_393028 [Flagelloscypha sp. PMI_526]